MVNLVKVCKIIAFHLSSLRKRHSKVPADLSEKMHSGSLFHLLIAMAKEECFKECFSLDIFEAKYCAIQSAQELFV